MEAILVPLGFFAMITAIVLVVGHYRHRERIEMIKSGQVPLPTAPGRGALMWGLVLTLVGLGYGLAVLALGMNAHSLLGAAIAVPIGVALLVYYRYTAPDRQRAERLLDDLRAHPQAPAPRTPAADPVEMAP